MKEYIKFRLSPKGLNCIDFRDAFREQQMVKRKKILILTANPKDTERLRLDEEIREIQEGLERAKQREKFEIIARSAQRTDDLRRALLDLKPEIVHFSGHGGGSDGLLLENNAGKMQTVPTESLVRLFKFFQDTVECVLLNACYSEEQAEAIHQHINCVIGMNKAVGDRTAITFSVGFYDALGAGHSFAEAFEMGCIAIEVDSLPGKMAPVLKLRPSKIAVVASNPDINAFDREKTKTAELATDAPNDSEISEKQDNLQSDFSPISLETINSNLNLTPGRLVQENSITIPSTSSSIQPVVLSPELRSSSPQPSLTFRKVMLGSLSMAVVVFIIRFLGLLQTMELGAYDHLVRSRLPTQLDDRIRIIAIRESDKQVQEQRNEDVQNTSISNASLEHLLDKLVTAQPVAIGLDLYRETPIEDAYSGLIRHFKSQPNLFGICKVLDSDISGDIVPGIQGPFQMPIERVAFSDFITDTDDVLRRYPLAFTPDGQSPCLTDTSFGLKVASYYLQKQENIQFSPPPSSKGGCIRIVRLDSGVQFRRFLPYTGGYQGEANIGGCQILINYESSKPIAKTFSLEEVLSGQIPETEFEDRIVLIGSIRRALENNDYWATPYGTSDGQHIAGIYIQAQLVRQLIQGASGQGGFIWVWPMMGEFLWICMWAMLGGWTGWKVQSPKQLGLAFSGTVFILYVICFVTFQFNGWIPLIPAVLVTLLNIIGVAWFKLYISYLNTPHPRRLTP